MNLHHQKYLLAVGSIIVGLAAYVPPMPAQAQAIPGPTGPAIAATQPSAQSQPANAQPGRGRGGRGRGPVAMPPPANPTLGLYQPVTLDFDTPDFNLKLVKASQTIDAMEPKGAKGFNDKTPFDFTPADQIDQRTMDGVHHLGDITFRIQQNGEWIEYSSDTARKPVTAVENAKVPAGDRLLAAADLTPTIAGTPPVPFGRGGGGGGGQANITTDCPLQITRSWLVDSTGKLVLHFDITNKSNAPVTIAGLGFPVIFNNMITNFTMRPPPTQQNPNPGPIARSLPEAHEICSFFDPYVGQDAGYLQVTRLSGAGPALLVTPEPGTKTPFEAYRPLSEPPPFRPSQTFEGAFEWTVHSEAYAETEWRGATPWNPPTSETLQPGQTVSHGLRFLVSDTIRDIEKTLAAGNRPVVVGIPGYILPMDIDGKLFVNYGSHKVTSIESDPPGALDVAQPSDLHSTATQLPFIVHGKNWGRAHLTLTYDDGTKQAVHYYVIKPAAEAVKDLGNFLFTKQWFVDPNDPFHRSPSIMTYDRRKNQIVTQDERAWIAGLGDEGGSSWLTGAMKLFGQPDKAEVDKFSEFVDKVLWGQLQISEGPQMYAVRKSLFYYDPAAMPDFKYDPNIRWPADPSRNPFPAWNKRSAYDATDRAYDYPHVVAAYWAMYRLARNNPGLVTNHDWQWYLDHAFNTVKYLTGGFRQGGRGGVGYLNTGLMEGDIFVFLLQDLKREGKTEEADYITTAMKRRADQWNREQYPFGSEMAWDSTGQEEVYAWTEYFGYKDKAEVSLDSILGYMPTVPHWGYNGNARRYWDFIYGGAPNQGIERQIHHYGSGINAIPALAQYRQYPDDYYLLRIGYGGEMGALSNIDQEGFAAAAFHSYPWNLRWDDYSGDYAQNFFGHAVNTGTYIINHPQYGWQAFGGNVKPTAADGAISVQTLDDFRKRVYIAPLGLFLTLDAGNFESVDIQPATKVVRITLAPAGQFTPSALLRIEQPAKINGVGAYQPAESLKTEREAFVIPLDAKSKTIVLNAK